MDRGYGACIAEVIVALTVCTAMGFLHDYQWNFLSAFDSSVYISLTPIVVGSCFATLFISRPLLMYRPPLAALVGGLVGIFHGALLGAALAFYAGTSLGESALTARAVLVEMIQQFPGGKLFPAMLQLSFWFGATNFIAFTLQSLWNFLLHVLRN